MNKLVKIGGILIVFLALAALIGSSMTFAQDEPDEPDTPDVTIPEGEEFAFPEDAPADRSGRGERGVRIDRGMRGEMFQEALAAELGITVDELISAKDAAQVSVLEQLVADGTITQEQMDEVLANQALRELAQEIFGEEDSQAVVAELLGVTVAELETAREEGTLRELADEAGVSGEEIRDAVSAARTEAIDAAVAGGTLTAEQAEQLQNRPERPGGRGHGGHGGPRGGNGNGTDFNNSGDPEA